MAQPYPAKPIRLIVPLAPGSTADIVSRFAAQELAKALGQPVVVENKPGAGGTIGDGRARARRPRRLHDRLRVARHARVQPGIYAKPGYDSLKDFAPIALFGGASNVMIVPPSNAAATPADIIAAAKAKPGKSTFSSGGAAPAITCPACCSAASPIPISCTFRTRARRRACWR